jgi:glycerol-3-phosphate dehydrogenase
MVIIGGGATGVGVAVDAASRGYEVLLLEQRDFGKGTSSRSTKLVHGGVRYLEQGNISLVMEALKERGLLRQNAPHLVHDLGFVVPNYEWWEAPFYGLGLKVYNLLAGRYGFGPSQILSRDETLQRLPTIKTHGLRGGVIYYDGQFDDARLLINLVTTAAEEGATLLNYVQVNGFSFDAEGFIEGIVAKDLESGEEFHARARVVINAAGPFCDTIRRLAHPRLAPMIAPSQGVHVVFDHSFLPGDSAIRDVCHSLAWTHPGGYDRHTGLHRYPGSSPTGRGNRIHSYDRWTVFGKSAHEK